jgi:cytochrome c peroxidase
MTSGFKALPSAVFLTVFACAAASPSTLVDRWSAEEIAVLRSIWIGELEPLGPDPTNRYADEPEAADLGHRLFFDTRLSSNGRVSCGTCHLPDRHFQDDLPLAQGVGRTDRRTMPIAGTGHAQWLFWDGRKDSLWSQALGPLESPVEHGGTRARFVHLVAAEYRDPYERVFGPLPDLSRVPIDASPVGDTIARATWARLSAEDRVAVNRAFANIGKAIAAYERRIQYGPSRPDLYIERLLREGRAPKGILTPEESAGMRLFIGKAQCINCHNGPLLTNGDFHNTGVPATQGLPVDRGRAAGAKLVLDDEFNCRSLYSDARPSECRELEYLNLDDHELDRAFKVPSLRGAADRPPYMHAGQIATLAEVIEHYDRAPAAPSGHSELRRLRLSRRERVQLEAYLQALTGPIDAPEALLSAPTPAPTGTAESAR